MVELSLTKKTFPYIPQRINWSCFQTLFSQFSWRNFFLNVKLWSRLEGVCADDKAGESLPRPWDHRVAVNTAQRGSGCEGAVPSGAWVV